MKKSLLALALALALAPAAARAASVGIGAFGGMSIPVVQDDNGTGTVFGVRLPVSVIPVLTVEPFYARTSGGEKEEDILGTTYTRSGIDVSAFGANVMLGFGAGLRFYPFAGIGSYKLERDGLDATSTGYTLGLGIGFTPPVTGLSIDLRGEVAAVLDEEDSDVSRKWANVTLGVSYALYSFPRFP